MFQSRPVLAVLVATMSSLAVTPTLAQTATTSGQQHSAPQQPGGQEQQTAQEGRAPVTRSFTADAGMVLNFIKPDKTADFEAVIAKLKEALLKSDKPERKQQAASWKVYRSAEPGANGSVLYVFLIDPAVKGVDYTVSTILAEGFPQDVQTLYKQYAEAYATGQNFVNLALVSNLAQAPVADVRK